MKKHLKKITVSALICLAAAGCHKKSNSQADTKKMQSAYGFMAKVPAGVDACADYYNVGGHIDDFAKSKTWQSISANPLVQPMIQKWTKNKTECLAKNPDCAKALAILQDAAHHEIFMVLGHGAMADIQKIQQFANQVQGKQVTETSVKALQVPPFLIGCKLTTQKTALAQEIATLEKKIPKGVAKTTFQFQGSPFTSLVFTAGKIMSKKDQQELKKMIVSEIHDPKTANDIFNTLMTKRLDLCYGSVGDYFLVSIGADHSNLKLASDYKHSVLALPEMAVLGKYMDKPLLGVSWTSKESLSLSAKPPKLMPYLNRFKPMLAKKMSAPDLKKLEADVQRIDDEGVVAFQPKEITPRVGVTWCDNGLFGETFGGIKYADSKPMEFSGVPDASTFLWMDLQSDVSKRAAGFKWIEDVASTAYGVFQKVGPDSLNSTQKMQYALFESIALPKLVLLYKTTRDQLVKSLGSENAFAMDLNGSMPAQPMIPPAVQKDGKIPRIATISEVVNPKLLSQSWNSYLKIANGALAMTPFASKFPKGIPQPTKKTEKGVNLYWYPIPMSGGDLLPCVATSPKTLVFSTSPAYAVAVSEAAQKPADAKPMMFDMKLNLTAAWNFAQTWVNLAAANPKLAFRGNAAAQKQFTEKQSNILNLISALHAFSGFQFKIYEENGKQRSSFEMPFHE